MKKTNTLRVLRPSSLPVFLLGLLGCNGAFAVDAAGAAEQVIITGTRPSLYDQRGIGLGALGMKDSFEVPLSAQSYSEGLIENQRARTLNDVLKNDASVQNASVGGAYDHVSLRGYAIDWANTMRREGLSLAPYQDVPLENVQRIDVLKGPSGFLYGFNAPGGTVNYVLKRPTAQPFTGVTAELRSAGGVYGAVDTSGSFDAERTLAYRFNLAGEKVGDMSHNGDLKRGFASAAIDARLAAGTLLRLDADVQRKKLAAQPLLGPQPDGQLPPMPSPRTLLGQPWLPYETRTYNFGARLDHQLDDRWSLTAQLGHSVNRRDAVFPDIYGVAANGDITSGDIYVSPGQRFQASSAQAYLSGQFAVAGLEHELVAGVSARRYTADDGGFIVLNDTVGNIFSPVYSAARDIGAAPAKNHTLNRQASVFASDLLRFSPQWQALLGLRHIAYAKDATPAASATQSYRQNVNAPTAGLIYRPLSTLMAYASATRGYEEGGVAPFNSANAGEWMDPIESRQVELGAKWAPSPGLMLSVAAFDIDKGLEYVDPSNNRYVQNGRQRHRGLELSAAGRVTPVLELTGSATVLDSVLRHTGNAATDGRRAANTARLQASVFADYKLRVAGLSLNGGVFHVGARPLDNQNTVALPGYTRLDLGLRYLTQIGGRKATLRAQVENATDRRYWAAASYASVHAGKPRTVSLAMDVEM